MYRKIIKSTLLNPINWFGWFLLLFFSFIVFFAKDYRLADRFFPWIIGIPAIILTIIQICLDLRLLRKCEKSDYNPQDIGFIDIAPDTMEKSPKEVRAGAIRFLSWYVGLYLGIWIVGFKISGPLFLFAFLKIEARARWFLSISLGLLSVYLIFYHFEHLLCVFWPIPLISRWFEIPWIF